MRDEVEGAGELAAVVDVDDESDAAGGSGVDGREDTLVQEKATLSTLGVEVAPRDLAGVVDAEACVCVSGASIEA
jgi:hypothetical protein